VRFVTREPAKDIFKSILVIPLDLIYVAFGLLLAGISGRIPAFVTHYESSKDADRAGMVLCVGLFIVACVLTWLDRALRLLWQKFYAAWSLAKHVNDSQPTLFDGQQVNRVKTLTFLWMFIYWSLMVPISLTELALSFESLGGILKRLQ
jgi:hypothetical protein